MKLRIPKFENTPYVVTHKDVATAASALRRFLSRRNTKTAVITGAGISTASGLPDYRGPNGTYTTNPDHKPTLFHEFVSDQYLRRRYWSRAWIGYEQALVHARPNEAHMTVHKWLQSGCISGIITQNVDGLHLQASQGTSVADHLVELHGSAYRVNCLSCGKESGRSEFQARFAKMNGWNQAVGNSVATSRQFVDIETGGGGYNMVTGQVGPRQQLNADGDAELKIDIDYEAVKIPDCTVCGGVLKPSIVFFGENVPEHDRTRARTLLEQSDQVLVIGTSLSTFSAFDLVRSFYRNGGKVAVLNKGGVRGEGKDWHAEVRLDSDIVEVLSRAV